MEHVGEGRGVQSSGGLLRSTMEVGRKLLKVEARKVKDELRGEARDVLSGAVLLGGAGLLALGGLAALTLSVAKVLLEHPGRAALLGLGLVGGAAGLAASGLKALPKRPLAGVGEQVRRDMETVARELT